MLRLAPLIINFLRNIARLFHTNIEIILGFNELYITLFNNINFMNIRQNDSKFSISIKDSDGDYSDGHRNQHIN